MGSGVQLSDCQWFDGGERDTGGSRGGGWEFGWLGGSDSNAAAVVVVVVAAVAVVEIGGGGDD